MSPTASAEHSFITLRSNWLTVDGKTLWADGLKNPHREKMTVSGNDLEQILLIGRYAILEQMGSFHAVWTAQLGTSLQTDGRDSQVFTEQGYANGGIITTIEELQPPFHGHWNAVKEAGFVPEVRRTSGKKDSGAWLALRKPSLPDVLQYWFNYSEATLQKATAAITEEKDNERQQRTLRVARLLGERAVDQASDTNRPYAQIELQLMMAALKRAIDDREGYDEEINSALMYAN